MEPKIRFILCTLVTNQDRNGNRYSATQIISTATGESVTIDHGSGHGGDNASHLVRKALELMGHPSPWFPTVWGASSTVTKKELRRFAANADTLLEHEVTPELITTLEERE